MYISILTDYPSLCQSFYLYNRLSFYLYNRLSFYLYNRLSFYLSIQLYIIIHLFTYLPNYISFCKSYYLYNTLYINPKIINLNFNIRLELRTHGNVNKDNFCCFIKRLASIVKIEGTPSLSLLKQL